jgi:hydroxyacylglutathione hydrolase
LAKLPAATQIYPGHDYIVNNLQFTLDREPCNKRAKTLLDEIAEQDPDQARVTTVGLEKEINTFFRLANPEVIEKLRDVNPDLPANPDEKTVFKALRELRNSW